MMSFFLLLIARMISGTNLFLEKSPPPITFPALTTDILFFKFEFLKKDLM